MPDDKTGGTPSTADTLPAPGLLGQSSQSSRSRGRPGEDGALPGVPEVGVTVVFAHLEGEWELRRTIARQGQRRRDQDSLPEAARSFFPVPPVADVDVSPAGTMLGRAVFTPLRPGVLHYREDGRLELASGHTGDAYREYYYLLEGDHIHVTFADAPPGERTFLRLRPRPVSRCTGPWAHDTHYCGRDVYTATYDFVSAGRLVVTMGVAGPEKDHVIRTVLTRDTNFPGDANG